MTPAAATPAATPAATGARSSPRLRPVWLGLAAALLLNLLLAGLHLQHKHRLGAAQTTQAALQLGLDDLRKGGLHFTLGKDGDTPWNPDRGRALLRQGLQRVDAVRSDHPLPAALGRTLQQGLTALVLLLGDDGVTADDPTLRVALHRAIDAGQALSRHLDQQRQTLERSLDRGFNLALSLSLLALAALAWGLHRAARAHTRAQRELVASEQRFRQLAESLPQLVWTCAPDGQCDYVSPRWTAWTGATTEAALGRGWLDFVHADERSRVESAWQQALAERTDFHAEFRLRLAGEVPTWVDSRATPLRDADGRTQRWFGAHTVIADIRQARADAEAAHALVGATLESTDNGILVCDGQGRVLMWNRRALDVPGLSEALLQQGRREAVIEAISGAARQPAAVRAALLRAGDDPVTVAPYEFIDGRTLELRSAPLHVAGLVAGRVLSLRDVTARQRELIGAARRAEDLDREVRQRTAALERAMAERSESEAFTRAITDSLPVMISYWNREQRCEFANRAYRDWVAPGGAPLVGLTRDEVLDPTQYQRAAPLVEAALQGQAQSFERSAPWPGGGERQLWSQYLPHRRNGEVVGFFVVVTDVTRIKLAQQQLEALNRELEATRDAAQAANQAKSEFLASMSHEIRTPMNVVLGMTRLLRSHTDDDEQRQRLDKINDAARHLLSIVDDVLDLSKIEAGRLQLEDANFPLAAVFDQVQSLIADQAGAKGLQVRVDATGAPTWLRGDPNRLRQALLNYAGNAVKFTARGSITLRARLLARQASRLQLRFEVEDSGVGLAPEQLARLFAAYEQADTSVSRRHGGTGLGLVITRRLAELMGGTAGADSQPGRGSCFWFTAWLAEGQAGAPLLPTTARAESAEDSLRQRHGGTRVLLAEDHPINQEIARELLQAAGLAVDVAADGREAVAMAGAGHYALVLMDMQMPQLDGLAATREIRRLPLAASTLPIIAMTANAFADDRAACLAAGMDDFITKPVDPDALYALLLRWLDGAGPAAGAIRVPANRHEAGTPAPPLAIEGVDTEQGLRLLRGDTAKYTRLLGTFARCHRADIDILRHPEGPAGDVARRLHALKGSAAAIGATALHLTAGALEARLRDGVDARALAAELTQLSETLQTLIERIDPMPR